MQSELITRINELAKIAKQRALTPEETAERDELRKEYLRQFRSETRAMLDNTYVQYPDGSKKTLREHNGKG